MCGMEFRHIGGPPQSVESEAKEEGKREGK